MYAIDITDLKKVYKNGATIGPLNMQIEEGSIIGLLGLNGAGKTTTIKMLTGILKPTSGGIKYFNESFVFGKMNPKNTGLLPDVPDFYSYMTAKEFLRLCGELLKMDKKSLDSRITEVLNMVNLENSNKKIKGYSRGMKQRLGIAQALLNEPRVLFLDEPTSALDPIGRKEVIDTIDKLRGKMTIVFSSHILSDIERVCDKVIIIDKGKIQLESNLEDLKKKYSINRLHLVVSEEKEAINLQKTISELQCVNDVIINGKELTLSLNNYDSASIEVPKIIAQNNIRLHQYNFVEPSLEEVFVKVVNN